MDDKKSIVVADDSDIVLTQCRELLIDDCRVRTLNSSLTLLRITESIKPVPDMILLDSETEELSGAEALPEIRAKWKDVPILLLTAWSTDFLFDHLFLKAAMKVLYKTIILSVLLARIKNYLELAEYVNANNT